MKKTKRTLLCLMLVIIMITTVAVPAMAVSGGNNKWRDDDGTMYAYTYSVTRKTASGVAYIYSTPATTVKAKAENTLCYELMGRIGTSSETLSGYSSVTATAGNIFIINGVSVEGTVTNTEGTFWINGTKVMENIVD